MSEITRVKTYFIADARTPDLDKCWSACNGIDGFGRIEQDEEMKKARHRHGELIETLPGAPRLILYRKTKSSELMAKLWYMRTITKEDNLILLLGSLANACFDNGGSTIFSNLHVFLMDLGPGGGERYEISIESVGEYCCFGNVKADYRRFMTRFGMGHWR